MPPAAWGAATIALLGLLPAYGLLSDRLGRKSLQLFSCIGNAALAYPAFRFMGGCFLSLFLFKLAAVIFLAPLLSNLAAFMA